MPTSIFRTFRSHRIDNSDNALRHDESSRLESLLAIACDGSAEDCYDEPGGEVPPSQPNPSGGRKPDPETQLQGGGKQEQPVAARIAETLLGFSSPAPAAA